MERIIIITGPTASGKSALAYRLATELNGAIINADSVQVYKRADIGSAKPSILEMARVPHFLFSKLDPREKFDAAKFARLGTAVISEVRSLGMTPIIAGGTGLYLKALLHGLVDLPASLVTKTSSSLDELSPDKLHALLTSVDPRSAEKIPKTDLVRVKRAIEISERTDHPASELREEHSFGGFKFSALVVVCSPDRDELYSLINQRTQEMLRRGLFREASDILLSHGRSSPIFRAIGYKEMLAVIDGELNIRAAEAGIAQNTRRLAKRQLTWWRNQPGKMGWKELPALGNNERSYEALKVRMSTFLGGDGDLAEDGISVQLFGAANTPKG